jgi:carbon storage regulator
MLILTRKPGESIYIGDGIKVIIVEIKGNQIRVGIEAPSNVRIYREEIYLQILEENQKAAEASSVAESGLEGLSEGWQGIPGAKPSKGGAASLFGAQAKTSSSSKLMQDSPKVLVKHKKGSKPGDE